jgi:putative ABC transport system substrate-binding protein
MNRRTFIAGLGGAVAWPLAARAQQNALPVVGYLSAATASIDRPLIPAFLRGLNEQGYAEGRNVEILYRFADLQFDHLPAMAVDLMRHRVALIVTTGPTASAAKLESSTIPVVFTTGSDPVASGLVASLNRPGGNVTGVTYLAQELTAKRLELLHEIVPTAASIGFLINPTNARTEADAKQAEIGARVLGVSLVMLKASSPREIEAAFATLVGQRIGALLVQVDPLFSWDSQVVALAVRQAVPAIYFVEAGGLISYGPSFSDAWRIAGTYAGRILKGEKPADLPVQRSTRIEMVINMKTAKSVGIDVPTSILLRADEVIE